MEKDKALIIREFYLVSEEEEYRFDSKINTLSFYSKGMTLDDISNDFVIHVGDEDSQPSEEKIIEAHVFVKNTNNKDFLFLEKHLNHQLNYCAKYHDITWYGLVILVSYRFQINEEDRLSAFLSLKIVNEHVGNS